MIDALDECQISDRSRTTVLDKVFKLQARYSLNFLETSRFIPDITARVESWPSLEIRASKPDVMRYLRTNVDKRLPSFVSRHTEFLSEITSEIADAVEGMQVHPQIKHPYI